MAGFGLPTIKTPKVPTPASGRGGFSDPRLMGITSHFRGEREKDLADGAARFDPLFGMNNPAMAEIMEARRKAAFGQDGQADIARAQGIQGINSTMSTGLRNLRGMQATSGVRGGAALGQAMPVLSQANQARGTLESNLALAEQQRKASALSGLESTLTGERAGSLGAQFGWAGLGAQDRSGALQWLQSKDFLSAARKGMGAGGEEGGKKAAPRNYLDPEWFLPEKYQKKIPDYLKPSTYLPADQLNVGGGGDDEEEKWYDPRSWG